MTHEVLRDRERPGDDTLVPPHEVTTGPTQLLTGLSVGLPTNCVVCVECATELTEGRAITVYCYRLAERAQWDLRRCYCPDCAPTTIETPTLGVTELLARAWLGTVTKPHTRTTRPCLTDVELVAYSSPQVGTQP